MTHSARLTLAASLAALSFPSLKASAQLARYGPPDPVHGFPRWYEDASGTRVTIGLEGDGVTGLTLFDPVDPNNPFSVKIGFGDEAFYWTADAAVDFADGSRAILVLALEAAFGADGSPTEGEQMVFGRFRVRFVPPASGTYTVIHPYGTEVFEDLPAGERLFYSHDFGSLNPDFGRALRSRIQPTFLRALDPVAPEGYLGNPQIEQTVTGSPTANNFFRIIGPEGVDLDGLGNNFVETNLFSVSGKTLIVPEWTSSGGGNWSTAANWAGPVPNVASEEALFLDSLQAKSIVNLDLPVTIGHITFDNANHRYTLAGNNTLTLQTTLGPATIRLLNGAHGISAPMVLAGDTDISGAGRLSTRAITNNGILKVRTIVSAGDITGPGSLVVGDGIAPAMMSANHVRQTALTIEAGSTLTINPNGTDTGTSRVSTLNIASSGVLDLADNALIVQADPDTRQTVLEQVTNLVASARNDGLGRWQGAGITSSTAASNQLTGLAVILNDQGTGSLIVTTIGGLPVDTNSVLIKYTWNGDVTLDGKVDASDYFLVDKGFLDKATGYRNGDLNYDGKVDASDYFLIDSAFLNQDHVLASPVFPQFAMVPEPATLSLLAGAWLAAIRHQPQRRRGT